MVITGRMVDVKMTEQFEMIDRLVHADQIPSWTALVSALDIADDRWRTHDPRNIEADELTAWQ